MRSFLRFRWQSLFGNRCSATQSPTYLGFDRNDADRNDYPGDELKTPANAIVLGNSDSRQTEALGAESSVLRSEC
jgi:hypothetical protein